MPSIHERSPKDRAITDGQRRSTPSAPLICELSLALLRRSISQSPSRQMDEHIFEARPVQVHVCQLDPGIQEYLGGAYRHFAPALRIEPQHWPVLIAGCDFRRK